MKRKHDIESLEEFLKFLRTRFTMIHNSSFFFRDLHYGVIGYFTSKGKRISYAAAEETAHNAAAALVARDIFRPVDERTWMVNYPEFALPKVEKKPPAPAPKPPVAAAAATATTTAATAAAGTPAVAAPSAQAGA
jgi:hypothetical protein